MREKSNMARKNPLKHAEETKHIGFDAAAEQAAEGAGVSMERGRAIIAAGARKASKAAHKANPRLNRVKSKKY